MSTIVLASQNPVKVAATREGFQRMFPDTAWEVCTITVPSGIRGQPLSNAETLQGARQRVETAMQRLPDAAYWVGIEGGIEDDANGMSSFSWVVIASREQWSQSRSGTFYLPPPLASRIRQGHELGDAIGQVFGSTNAKHASGAIGLLTAEVLTRTQLYAQAVVLALVPFTRQSCSTTTHHHADHQGKATP